MRRRGLVVLIAVAVLLGAWCGWASGFHTDSWGAVTTWLVSLAGVVAVDIALCRGRHRLPLGRHLAPASEPWPRRGRGGSRRALAGVWPWLVLIAVAVAWDVLGIDTGRHQAHLTISALAQTYRPINAALLLVWILVGLGYGATRARTPVESRAVTDDDAPGNGALWVALALPARTHGVVPALLLPSSRPIGVIFWVAVPIVAVLVDLMARRSGGRIAKAEEFMRFISTAPVAKVLLVLAWTFAGYHLFAR